MSKPQQTANLTPKAPVTLREITKNNIDQVLSLSVSKIQKDYVASNENSLRQAAGRAEAWPRAIYADETPVGFLMLHDEHLRESPRRIGYYYLWRMMIDARYQGMGFGARAFELLVKHVRSRPHARELLSSYKSGPDSAKGFYYRLGFEPTGEEHNGEIHIRYSL